MKFVNYALASILLASIASAAASAEQIQMLVTLEDRVLANVWLQTMNRILWDNVVPIVCAMNLTSMITD